MSLRKRTIFTISILLLFLLLTTTATMRTTLLDSFAQLEEEFVKSEVEEVLFSLNYDLESMNRTVGDWSSWDDTYAFIQNSNPEYIKYNLIDSTFTDLKINVMLFFDSSGRVVYGKAMDLDDEKATPLPEDLVAVLTPHLNQSSFKGLVVLSGGPMMVVGRPVLTSLDDGPAMGTLVMGRYLDTILQQLSAQTRNTLVVEYPEAFPQSASFIGEFPELPGDPVLSIDTVNRETVAGWITLEDINDMPSVAIRTDIPRSIYLQGMTSVLYLIISVLITGLAFGALVILIIEREVLSPLTLLNAAVQGIGNAGSPSRKLPVKGDNELTTLAININESLNALDYSRQLLVKTFASLKDALFIIDADTTEIVDCNPSASEIFGYSHQEMLGKATAFLHADRAHLENFRAKLEAAVEEKGYLVLPEFCMKRKDGTVFPTEHTVLPLKDEQGRIVDWVSVVRDITDRKHAENSIRETERKLNDIINFLPDATFVIDKEGRIIAWNRAIETMTGITAEEIMGKGNYEYSIPFYGERRPILIDLVLRQQEDFEGRYDHLKRGDGTIYGEACMSNLRGGGIYLGGSAAALYNSQQELVGAIESVRDITEKKRSEKALKDALSQLEATLNAIPDLLFEVDKEGRIYSYHTFDQTSLYTSPERFMGKQVDEVLPQEATEVIKRAIAKAALTGESRGSVYSLNYPAGNSWFELAMVAKGGPTDDDCHFIALARNITNRVEVERQLEKLNRDLDQMVRERTEDLEVKREEMERFIYTVSHDLRSPLITISGFAGFLRKDLEEGLYHRADKDLKMIEEAVSKMDQLLLDTLELSRIGRVANPPEDVAFNDIVDEALDQTREKINSFGVEVSVKKDLPLVHVDRMKLVEVLVNLLENSLRYMGDRPDPKIEIGNRMDEEETVFYVRDNGIGIDPSQHDKVFDLFYTVNKNVEGTGVGLAIVKRIIEVHGGWIGIESELCKGCTICFTLPLCKTEIG